MVAIALIVSMLPTAALAGVAEGQAASPVAEQDAAADGATAEVPAEQALAGNVGTDSSAQQAPAGESQASADKAPAADAEQGADGAVVETPAPGGVTDAGSADASRPAGGETEGAADDAATDPATIEVKCAIIGPDAASKAVAWAPESAFEVKEGSKADALIIAAFERAKLTADYDPDGAYGFDLKTITSPFDDSVLGYDAATGKYWQLFVNGKASDLGASSVDLQAGDEVTLAYTAYGEGIPQLDGQPAAIEAKCSVIGIDADGNPQAWAPESSFAMTEGANAADMTIKAFEAAGITADYDPDGTYGFYLNTITSPFDGRVLGCDDNTKKYWQLFVNGKPAAKGASEIKLRVGDTVAWYYATDGASLPSKGDLVIDPAAPRPDVDSSWPGFAGGPAGPVVTSPTPTDGTKAEWTYDFKDGGWYATVSDPLIVDGDIFIMAMGKIQRIDGDTGALVASAPTGEQTQQICRLAYADGLIIVPMDRGKIAAYTADTLTCVWKTPALADFGDGMLYQAMSTVTIANGFIYTMFAPGSSWAPSDEGVMVCVSLNDGSVQWTKKTGKSDQSGAGYYWAGAAVSGDELIVGDDAGNVMLVDGDTGDTITSIALSDRVRAGVVAADVDAEGDGVYLAVTQNDGVLHKVERTGNTLKETASVDFAVCSTSTPSVVDGKAVVCGADSENAAKGNGLIAVIDIATMTIESNVVAGLGLAQASPLISVQGDGTYAYFTCNNKPGGVYRYKLGDDKAEQIFIPEQALQNFTVASIVADAAGNLYYTNDSGTLFKLSAAPSFSVSFETNGGSHMPASLVAQNKPMNKPGDPVREGHLFLGWYADKELTQPWDFSAPVAGNITLFAKWGEDVDQGGGIKPPIDPDDLEPTPQPRPPASDDTSQTGPSAPIINKVPVYTVVTTRTPLVGEQLTGTNPVVADETVSAAAAEKSVKGATAAEKVLAEPASSEGAQASAALNPVAVAGIAIGAVGLLGVILYLVFARRRAGM